MVLAEQNSVSEQSREAIYALLDNVQTAWGTGNVDQYGNAFSEDAIFVPFNGTRLNGRGAIIEFHREPFANFFRGGRLDIDVIDIRNLAPDIFLVATNGGPLRAGESSRAPETQTYVIKNLGTRYSIVFFQNTPVLPH